LAGVYGEQWKAEKFPIAEFKGAGKSESEAQQIRRIERRLPLIHNLGYGFTPNQEKQIGRRLRNNATDPCHVAHNLKASDCHVEARESSEMINPLPVYVTLRVFDGDE